MKNTTNSANEKGQEYQLPEGLQNDMLNLDKEVKKSKDRKSIFSRPATYLTMLTTALTLNAADAAFSQTNDKPDTIPTFSIEMVKDYPSLKAIVDDFEANFKVDLGDDYPAMKQHLEDMIAQLGIRTEIIEETINIAAKPFADRKQQLLVSIVGIEQIMRSPGIWGKCAKQFDANLIKWVKTFRETYLGILDQHLKEAMSELNLFKENKQKLIISFQKFEKTLEWLSVSQVQESLKKPDIQQWLSTVKKIMSEEKYKPVSPHTQEILNLVP